MAAFLMLRPSAPPPSPPIYRVQLIAAPAGERAIGVVQDVPPVTVAEPTPVPVAPPVPKSATIKARPTPAKPTTVPKTVPKAATPTPKPVEKQQKPAKTQTPAPTAGGGPVGGKGADVANVDTPGIEFPYPGYTQNITRQLILRFGRLSGSFEATVRFVIRRDGTVDPESIKLVTSDGDYSFKQRALGAVEAAANAKSFGPLPAGYQEDILPVTFRFSPSLNR